MADLQLILTPDGSDFVLRGNDIQLIEGFQNMPLIALFGGNPEQSTPQSRQDGEQLFDWWGNSLLMNQQSEIQYNSVLERTLRNRAITSSSRTEIIQVVQRDLQFMQSFAQVEIDASILTADSIKINIKLTRPDNLELNEFTYIWNATSQKLTPFGIVTTETSGEGVLLDQILNYEL